MAKEELQKVIPMQPTVDTLAAAVSGEAGNELDAATRTIEHCLAQLDDAQVWWRPDESMKLMRSTPST